VISEDKPSSIDQEEILILDDLEAEEKDALGIEDNKEDEDLDAPDIGQEDIEEEEVDEDEEVNDVTEIEIEE